MENRQQDKECFITYPQQSEVDGNMRPGVSNISRKSILCVATTGEKDSSESEGHDRKLTQTQG